MNFMAPTREDIVAAVREHGSLRRAGESLGYSEYWMRYQLKHDEALSAEVSAVRAEFDYHGKREDDKGPAPDKYVHAKVQHRPDGGVDITWPTDEPKLGDIGQLIRQCGLVPDEWTVVSLTLNKWEGMTAPQLDESGEKRNQKMPLQQWKVTLKRAARLVLAMPAVHVPPLKRKPRAKPREGAPELFVIEGDHHAPRHDQRLHEASLWALNDFYRDYNMTRHVFLGDTMDLPTISQHRDHPTDAPATPNVCIQAGYDLLRQKREAAPVEKAYKLKGNHDDRIEGEQLARSEREYGIRPAQQWEADEPEIPALDLRRLLHLDKLGIELIVNPRGWMHAEVELIPGMAGLVARHGWITGANTAGRSLTKRGRSIIVGHAHNREHVYQWDQSAEVERQAVVSGTMSAVRGDNDHPHFTVQDTWLQGFVTVTLWPDGQFVIDHVRWNGESLRWRDRIWRP